MSVIIIPGLLKEITDHIVSFVNDKRAMYVVLNKKMTQLELWQLILNLENYPKHEKSTLIWIKRILESPPKRFLEEYYIGEVPPEFENEMDISSLSGFVSEWSDLTFYDISLYGIIKRKCSLYFWIKKDKLLLINYLRMINISLTPSWDYTPCIFYHSVKCKESNSNLYKHTKTKELTAYHYCTGVISFESAVKQFYK